MTDTRSGTAFDISAVNEAVKEDKKKLLSEGEAGINKEVERTADFIISRGEELKIVLVSGRSASGKTTFTKKVCEKLSQNGREAKHISLDDFLLGLNYMPLNEDGTYDMESIKGLDTALANECFRLLLEKGVADFPTFDFPKQRRGDKWNRIETGENGLIVIEGIHALNPLLTENLPEKGIMRIYIEPEKGYELCGKSVLSADEVRLMRRMTRDELFRGWSAEKTLAQWKSVKEGEKIYIEPYIPLAEVKVNTSFFGEPTVFKRILSGMLSVIKENSRFFDTAQDFLEKLSVFDEAETDFLEKDSLLREFVG